jgi:hypothetical protein
VSADDAPELTRRGIEEVKLSVQAAACQEDAIGSEGDVLNRSVD